MRRRACTKKVNDRIGGEPVCCESQAEKGSNQLPPGAKVEPVNDDNCRKDFCFSSGRESAATSGAGQNSQQENRYHCGWLRTSVIGSCVKNHSVVAPSAIVRSSP